MVKQLTSKDKNIIKIWKMQHDKDKQTIKKEYLEWVKYYLNIKFTKKSFFNKFNN
jgi:hypothetical protein